MITNPIKGTQSTTTVDDKIALLVNYGFSAKAIAEKYGLTRTQVYGRAYARGLRFFTYRNMHNDAATQQVNVLQLHFDLSNPIEKEAA